MKPNNLRRPSLHWTWARISSTEQRDAVPCTRSFEQKISRLKKNPLKITDFLLWLFGTSYLTNLSDILWTVQWQKNQVGDLENPGKVSPGLDLAARTSTGQNAKE